MTNRGGGTGPVQEGGEVDLVAVLDKDVIHGFLGNRTANGPSAHAKELCCLRNGKADLGVLHRCNEMGKGTSSAKVSGI